MWIIIRHNVQSTNITWLFWELLVSQHVIQFWIEMIRFLWKSASFRHASVNKIKCLNQKKLIEVPRFSFSSHWFSFSMVNLTWVCSVTLEPLVWVFFTFLPLENTIAHKNLKDKNEKTDEKSFCNKLDTTWAFERLKICTKIKWLTPSVLLLAAAQPAMWKKGKQLHTQSNFQEV